jgi:mRNA interferase MazF
MPERYGVYWVNLDPAQGSELKKTRPAVVVSDDAMNRNLATVVVCPLTSVLHPRWPSRVQAVLNGKDVEIAVDQIRTIRVSRLGKHEGQLDDTASAAIRHVITEMYGLLSLSIDE